MRKANKDAQASQRVLAIALGVELIGLALIVSYALTH
jgi:hypothetical protein